VYKTVIILGIAGYHAMMALEHDMIGIALTNASPLVAPTFSVERLLGTNPICVVIPAGESRHLWEIWQQQRLPMESLRSSNERMVLLRPDGSKISRDILLLILMS
jgi:hypothetical protein